MYGGRIAEVGSVLDIFDQPKHPYTWGLLNCLPAISERREKLSPIPGMIPSLVDPPEGCIFYPRCQWRMPACQQKRPAEFVIEGEQVAACYLYA